MRVTGVLFLLGFLAIGVQGQRPRAVDPVSKKTDSPTTAPAPQTMKAKYEGGVFGHNNTMEGTLAFDDTNQRLLFRNKKQQEVIFIPYTAVTAAFADTKKKQPAAASVASSVPLIYAWPAHFIKKKVRYLTIQFSDPDSHVGGITSFRLENKEIIASALRALGEKAGLTMRGEVYVKKRDSDSSTANP
jgi:hypothetical protein